MTDASKRAYAKYDKKFDKMTIRLPEGKIEQYRQAASTSGMSLNAFVISVLDEAVKKGRFSESLVLKGKDD